MIHLPLQQKNCMAHLLLRETFDSYQLISADITTFNRFQIDGYLQKEFYEDASEETMHENGGSPESDGAAGMTHSRWGDVREFCYHIIKGKRTPLSFQLVLALSPQKHETFLKAYQIEGIRPSDIGGLYLNFRFDGKELICVTGTSLNIFTLDRSVEQAWDNYVQKLSSKYSLQ